MQTLNTGCLIVLVVIIVATILAGVSAYKLKSSKGTERTELK